MTQQHVDTKKGEPPALVKHRKLPIEIHIGSALLVIMTGILFAQVVARFVFNNSFFWSEEISRYIFIWLVFLGIGALIQLSEHITIDVLSEYLPERFQRIHQQFVIAVMTAVNVLLLVLAWRITFITFEIGELSPAVGLPFWIVYASLPVGLSIAVIRGITTSISLWRPASPGEQPEESPSPDSTATPTGESR